MDIFTVLFYQPVYNLLVIFYRLFGGDLGLAIIVISILSRLITLPITLRQIETAQKNQEMSDKLNSIKKKYKNNKEKQTEEMMKLQGQYFSTMLGGCLPFILLFVLLINILNVIRNIIEVGVEGFNQVAYGFVSQFPAGSSVNTSFLGFIDLTKSAGTLGYDDIGRVLPYIILAVLVGVTQYLSTQIMMGIRKKKGEATGRKSEPSKDRKQGEPEDFGQIFQQSTKQTMAILPILIVFMSLNFPAGLSLYWTVQSAFVIIQQLIVDRLKRNG